MQDRQFMGRMIHVTDLGRRRSGITNGTSWVVPHEDLDSNVATRNIMIELPSHVDRLCGDEPFLAVHYYFLSDANTIDPQYGVRQECESWFSIVV